MIENKITFDLEKKLWTICSNYFDHKFKNLSFKNKIVYKVAFIKFMTIKLQNSKEFINLLTKKKGDKEQVYFYHKDMYEIAKFYFKNKNIRFRTYRNILKILQFNILLTILQFVSFKTKKENIILFFINNKKYQPVFDYYINNFKLKKESIVFYKNIFSYLKYSKIRFCFSRRKNYEQILIRTGLESLLSIIINEYCIKNFLLNNKLSKIISCEGDTPENYLFSKLKNKETKSICFQWGTFVKKYVKNGFKKMDHDIFFCWGKYFKKKLEGYNKDTKFYVVGNPFIEEQNKFDKKIVFLLSPKTIFISKEVENSFFTLIDQISKKVRNYSIILRYHPSESVIRILNLKLRYIFKKNIIIHNPKKKKLSQSLNKCHIVIGIRSGAVFESSSSNIITIIYNNEIDLENYFNEMKLINLLSNDFKYIYNLIFKIITQEKKYNIKLKHQIKRITKKYIEFTGLTASKKINKSITMINNKLNYQFIK